MLTRKLYGNLSKIRDERSACPPPLQGAGLRARDYQISSAPGGSTQAAEIPDIPLRKRWVETITADMDGLRVRHSVADAAIFGVLGSFEPSSLLFSLGFTVDRTTMTLFSMSNQKGAPREIARAVMSHPGV